MKNIQHSTFNAQRRSFGDARAAARWALNVQCSVFNVCLLALLFAPLSLCAQLPPQLPPGGLAQLQVAQPPVNNSLPVTATATFDPPVVRAGEKTFYRVTVTAADSSIQWPGKIAAAPELKFGRVARGQMMQLQGNQYRPVTAFTCEVQAATPGRFVISNLVVNAAGQPVEIPAAAVQVVAANASPLPPARELELEVSATNVFLGQPVRVRVLLPAARGNEIDALREVQINGNGVMTDKTSVRQAVETLNRGGQLKPAFVYEATVTPIATGPLELSAQAFTAGREFSGPISITGPVVIRSGPFQYDLLVSEPLELKVRPLPADAELPGFTGAMGVFIADKPQLATNRIHVGEPVRLRAAFHGVGGLSRFVPPVAPRSRDWQIIADPPPATGFTLIPLTDEVAETPAIPFCAFNPAAGEFVDLTIPPLSVTVIGESLPTQLPAFDDAENPSPAAPLKLSGLAPTPGKTAASLRPLQLRGGIIGLQLLPALGFLALWEWDRRRRFLAAHPEIVRRRQARRALRREKIELQKSAAAGDANQFIQHAANAMKIACAPHFPAHPQALVCGEVLSQLEGAEPAETVRKVFAAADSQFADAPQTPADLLALKADVEAVLKKLEEKL
jgi:hypothetical protein